MGSTIVDTGTSTAVLGWLRHAVLAEHRVLTIRILSPLTRGVQPTAGVTWDLIAGAPLRSGRGCRVARVDVEAEGTSTGEGSKPIRSY